MWFVVHFRLEIGKRFQYFAERRRIFAIIRFVSRQETGRAGRDGLPSECVLLFSASDVAKQIHFIDEKNESEARIARAQLRQMVHYAETRECRRATLLSYFGEDYPEPSCEG